MKNRNRGDYNHFNEKMTFLQIDHKELPNIVSSKTTARKYNMITKCVFILRGSCFCEKYSCNQQEI